MSKVHFNRTAISLLVTRKYSHMGIKGLNFSLSFLKLKFMYPFGLLL